MRRARFVCGFCGEEVECGENERPCDVLSGWLLVSLLKGPEAVEHCNFCSLTCLKTWIDAQVSQVPDAFLRAFEKTED